MDKIAAMIRDPRIVEAIPEELLHLKHNGQLNKYASHRLGLPSDNFGLREAVYGMAKSAYLHRNQWKVISAGLSALREMSDNE